MKNAIHLLAILKKRVKLQKVITGGGATLQGRNGGGDYYYTDGEVTIGVLTANNQIQTAPISKAPNPALVEMKNKVWSSLRHMFN